jgi:hypothetical protein
MVERGRPSVALALVPALRGREARAPTAFVK